MLSKILSDKGWSEVVINDNCDLNEFQNCINVFKNSFKMEFKNVIDDFDSYYCFFTYKGEELILHYNVYMGISIFPSSYKDSSEPQNILAEEFGIILYNKINEPI